MDCLLKVFTHSDNESEDKEVSSVFDTRSLTKNLKEDKRSEEHEKVVAKGYMGLMDYSCTTDRLGVYTKQITRNAHIYIEELENGNGWISYRLTYSYIDGSIKSERTIAEERELLQVANQTESYIENYLNFIRRK